MARRNPTKLKPNPNCSKHRYTSREAAIRGFKQAKQATITYGWTPKFYRCEVCRDSDGKRTWHWAHVRPTIGEVRR